MLGLIRGLLGGLLRGILVGGERGRWVGILRACFEVLYGDAWEGWLAWWWLSRGRVGLKVGLMVLEEGGWLEEDLLIK
jgi:hypothetical protein